MTIANSFDLIQKAFKDNEANNYVSVRVATYGTTRYDGNELFNLEGRYNNVFKAINNIDLFKALLYISPMAFITLSFENDNDYKVRYRFEIEE